MSGAYTAARVTAVLSVHGEAMLLKRLGQADLPVKAKRRMAARAGGNAAFSNSAELSPEIIHMCDAEISAAGWPGPPVAGDVIALADGTKEWSIDKVDTRTDSGVVVSHFLYMAG